MIPKKIHYCWFGKGPKPDLVTFCMKSWKTYLPDYELVEWNESNFDVNCNLYVKQAYESKKYSFVSDYVRLYALFNQGGIYLDTDVEVKKNLDIFLNLDGFTGFEDESWPVTATLGSIPNNHVIKRLLTDYDSRRFITSSGLDLITNTKVITKIFNNEYNIELNGKQQNLEGTNFIIFPKDYFCGRESWAPIYFVTDNTYTIHHFNASWWD